MAGRHQHFLPRFLQRGFLDTTAPGEAIWLHRRDRPVFRTGIAVAGVEVDFYEDANGNSVDEQITEAEKSFSNLVSKLRQQTSGSVPTEEISTFLVHLEVRSRNLREAFLDSGEYLVKRLTEFIDSGEPFVQLLERSIKNDPSILSQAISENLAKQGLPASALEPVLELVKPHISVFIESLRPTFPAFASKLRAVLPEVFADAARRGHVKVLTDSVAPKARIDNLMKLSYSIVDGPDHHFVLGDSAVFYFTSGKRPYKPFLDKDDLVTAAILPLSHKRVLIGTNGDTPNLASIRGAAAHCSLEFFVASHTSKDLEQLRTEIGQTAGLLTDAEMDEIIGELISGKNN